MKTMRIWLLGLCGLFFIGCGGSENGPAGGISAKGDTQDFVDNVNWQHVPSANLRCGSSVDVNFPVISKHQDMVGFGYSVASEPGKIQTFEFEIPGNQRLGGAIVALIRADRKYLENLNSPDGKPSVRNGYFVESQIDYNLKLVYTVGDIPEDQTTKLLVGVTLPRTTNPYAFTGKLHLRCSDTPAVALEENPSEYGTMYKATLTNTSNEAVFIDPCSAFQWEKKQDDGTFMPAGWANRCYYFRHAEGGRPDAIGRPVPSENTPETSPSSLSIAPPELQRLERGASIEVYLNAPTVFQLLPRPLPMPMPEDGGATPLAEDGETTVLSSYMPPPNNWPKPELDHGTFRVKTSYFVGCQSRTGHSYYIWDMDCTMNTTTVSAQTIFVAAPPPPPQNGICWFNDAGQCVSQIALMTDASCCQQRCAKISQYYTETLPLAQSCQTTVAGQCAIPVRGRLNVCFSGCTAWVTDDSALQPILADWEQAGCGREIRVCPMAAVFCPETHGECTNDSNGEPTIPEFGSCKSIQ